MNKKVFISIFALMLILAVMLIPFTTAQEGDDQPRTYYESLDLSSPETAVTTFVEAFQREDYFTVYLILDPEAQTRFMTSLRLGDYGKMFKTEFHEPIIDELVASAITRETREYGSDGIFVFDVIMLAAAQYDAFLIDLRSEVKIISREEGHIVVPETGISPEYEFDAVDVHARIEGSEGEVIFRTVQSPSGRWRVRQVILTGSDETMLPWAVPTPKPDVIIDVTANWETACDDTPPDQPPHSEDETYLIVTPTCGEGSGYRNADGSRQEGTTITLQGYNFEPNARVEIVIKPENHTEFRVVLNGERIRFTPDENGEFIIEFPMPNLQLPMNFQGSKLVEIIARQSISQE